MWLLHSSFQSIWSCQGIFTTETNWYYTRAIFVQEKKKTLQFATLTRYILWQANTSYLGHCANQHKTPQLHVFWQTHPAKKNYFGLCTNQQKTNPIRTCFKGRCVMQMPQKMKQLNWKGKKLKEMLICPSFCFRIFQKNIVYPSLMSLIVMADDLDIPPGDC